MPQDATPLTVRVTEMLRRLADAPPDVRRLEEALRLLAKWRSELLANTIAKRAGATVQAGPFKGLIYTAGASEGARAARLLGAYEASLWPVIETAVRRPYRTVIDVGAAEGYYAVGLARRMPKARIHARDSNPDARARCQALAEANGVADRVIVGGPMAHGDFALCQPGPALVLCDIEGAEDQLLDPELAPGLTQADILVEAHDCLSPGLSARLAERFAATHRVRRIDRTLAPESLPGWMEELSDLDRALALWEWRTGPTPWLWMERK